MKIVTKIALALLAVVIIIASYILYGTFINPKSPRDTVTLVQEDLTLEVDYSQPFKKDRLIFGNAADGALVPYGTYWRLGANFATTFETNKEISFAGRSLAAGKYRVYTVPEDDHWVISLNSEFGSFGYTEPDYEKDIMSVNIASAQLMTAIEQFTIDFVEGDDSLSLRFRWDTTSVSLPIN
ncbi:DUF2911 domain-containing protein [Flavobacteriaceae bacterium]|nr:DUF2911 domain-containing protein [Flavobacteriaceae bacterium]